MANDRKLSMFIVALLKLQHIIKYHVPALTIRRNFDYIKPVLKPRKAEGLDFKQQNLRLYGGINLTFNHALLMLGGAGLLLYGIKMMSGGLETIAGDSLKRILQKATSNRFLAIFVGMVATIALNSSTGTTVMTVGFVHSGLLNLTQAIGIIMGANVGTTFSAQLIAFGMANISLTSFAVVFIFIGSTMHIFFKNSRVKNIGYVILGFGIAFFGIATMSDAMRPLRTDEAFQAFLVGFENPALALLAGFAVTAVIQSSTATTAILVTLLATGLYIPFQTAAFILLGVNIGTSLTAVIASIPANRDSKRAALFHISYDIIGGIVFGSLILIFPGILDWFTRTWTAPEQQAAMFHTLYNVSTMFLLLPFIKYITTLMMKIVPVIAENTGLVYEKKFMFLDGQISKSPTMAVVNAHMEICRMGKIANENLSMALEAFYEKDVEKAKIVMENEGVIDFLHQNIASKLAEITNKRLSTGDAKKVGDMFVILSDIERVGDHAENIAEYTQLIVEDSLKFSEIAIEELQAISKITIDLMDMVLSAYEKYDKSKLPEIKELEDKVDSMASEFARNHFKRLKSKKCKAKSGVVFMDIINDLEKTADIGEKIVLSLAE